MKKLLGLITLSLILMTTKTYAQDFRVDINGKKHNVTEVTVNVNDNNLKLPFKAYVKDGRTFVPIRELTESLGANVGWEDKVKSATVMLDGNNVKMKIGSNIVFINGEKKTIDKESAPAFTKYYSPNVETKTMVPLRFLSEAFGYNVKWDSKTYTATISTTAETASLVDSITKDEEKNKEEQNKTNISTSEVKKDETNNSGTVNKEETKPKKVISKKIKADGPVTIVLDAGHGGKDSGAPGLYNTYEKNIALSVTQKLYDKLNTNTDYEIILTRDDDYFINLYERPEIANRANAELFLSLHLNSSQSNPDAEGIEVYYAPAAKNALKTVEQSPFAECLQRNLIKETGAYNRKIKDGGALVVLRKTKNVAALAELGFMTNKEEVLKLDTDEYQDKLAQGLYNGILEYVENYVEK